MHLTLYGTPITKKNSQQIIIINGHPSIKPSKQFILYEAECKRQLFGVETQTGPVNVQCVYYMPTRRRVDLTNLLSATCDILVAAGVLIDDNSNVVTGHDGSRVCYDRDNPRVEITIDGGPDNESIPFYP